MLLKRNQRAFCKGMSHLPSLLEFFERVCIQVDMGNLVDIICRDFKKAFDRSPG